MPKLPPLCLAAALLLLSPIGAVHAAPTASEVDPAIAASIDAMAAAHYKADAPGATLLVVKDGKTVLRKAYGMADVANNVRMQAGTAMRVGSMTKQFTSAAILLLADEGKLSLSDPVTKFLPAYPTHGKTITVEHLLTHTSGIVNYTSMGSISNREKSIAQMIDGFKDEPLEFEPGTRYAYNNSGYFLLGAIIEKVSGQPYAKFLEQRIFTPLGMTQTAYDGYGPVAAPRAAGHIPRMWGGFGPVSDISMSQVYAAGALVSTVDDMAKWDAAVGNGMLLKPETWARAFTPYKLADGKDTGYGYGWAIAKVRGAHEISHGGDINGFSGYALRLPEQQVYVALLTNADSGAGLVRPAVVAKKAAAIAIGQPYPDYRPVAVDTGTLDTYAGAYQLNEKTTRTVRRDGDHLQVQRAGRPTLAIYPMGGDRFFTQNALTIFRFDRNAAGAIGQLVLDDDGAEQVHSRVK
jgi:D-alanyl-D-alanine carboxypeptidase